MSFIETSTPEQLLAMAQMMAENRKAIRSHQQDLQLGRERSEADREKQAAPVVKGILGAPTKEGSPATGLEKLVEKIEDVDRSTQDVARTTGKHLKKIVKQTRPAPDQGPAAGVPEVADEDITIPWILGGEMARHLAQLTTGKMRLLQRINHKLGLGVATSGRGRNAETVERLIVSAAATHLNRGREGIHDAREQHRGDVPHIVDDAAEDVAGLFPDPEPRDDEPGTADDDAAGVFPRTADEDLDELMHGNGIPKFRPRMPYTADPASGRFGRLRIDLPRLVAVGRTPKLVAFDAAGKQVLSVKADDTLVRLVLNRFDEKTPYTPAAIAAFRALVRKANLPVAKHSTKWKRFLQADEEQVGGGVRFYRTPEAMLARTQLLLGERAAGNQAPEVARELFDCLEELLRTGVITKPNYVAIRRKYLG